jgi:hypothetical protein
MAARSPHEESKEPTNDQEKKIKDGSGETAARKKNFISGSMELRILEQTAERSGFAA